MGWTGVYTKKTFDTLFKEEFGTYIYDGSIIKYKELKVQPPLETGVDEESEFFCAWRNRNNSIGCTTIIFKRMDNEVLWKIQDETVGPFMINKCPKDIMNLLSPLSQLEYVGYAKEFRRRQ